MNLPRKEVTAGVVEKEKIGDNFKSPEKSPTFLIRSLKAKLKNIEENNMSLETERERLLKDYQTEKELREQEQQLRHSISEALGEELEYNQSLQKKIEQPRIKFERSLSLHDDSRSVKKLQEPRVRRVVSSVTKLQPIKEEEKPIALSAHEKNKLKLKNIKEKKKGSSVNDRIREKINKQKQDRLVRRGKKI